MEVEGLKKHWKLVKAFKDGKQIQFKRKNGEWEDVSTPSFSPTQEYRVKPEPVSNMCNGGRIPQNIVFFSIDAAERRVDCIKTPSVKAVEDNSKFWEPSAGVGNCSKGGVKSVTIPYSFKNKELLGRKIYKGDFEGIITGMTREVVMVGDRRIPYSTLMMFYRDGETKDFVGQKTVG